MTCRSGKQINGHLKTRQVGISSQDLHNMASAATSPDHADATNTFEARQAYESRLQGTALFDYVRDRFCQGIVTLDSVLSSMKLGNCGTGSIARRQDIDGLLDNLIAMARWLVHFLQIATACSKDSTWARSAIIGLRVELHQCSRKVMQISGIMQSVKAFRIQEVAKRVKANRGRVIDIKPKKTMLEREVFQPLGIGPEDIRLPDERVRGSCD